MDKAKKERLARNAKLVAENEVFIQSFEAVKQSYIDQILNTKYDEVNKREYFHICVNALEDVKNVLTIHLQNAKIADKELRKRAKKVKK